nr:protein tyrosine/serine phosphatase [Kibdelosporangium sp. MJ126-NF4]
MEARDLDWPGLVNVRDLGGLPTADGNRTRMRAVVRADAPERLTPDGWTALREYGVRTIVDLRNDDERTGMPDLDGIDVLSVPLDPLDDKEFWNRWGNGLHGTALYFQPYLERFPHLPWAALSAIARARPGGVLVNCAAGRDRTGLVVILLLAMAGVPAEVIADDYEASSARLSASAAARGMMDIEPAIAALVTEHGTTSRELVLDIVRRLDIGRYVSTDDLPVLRDRLVGAGEG